MTGKVQRFRLARKLIEPSVYPELGEEVDLVRHSDYAKLEAQRDNANEALEEAEQRVKAANKRADKAEAERNAAFEREGELMGAADVAEHDRDQTESRIAELEGERGEINGKRLAAERRRVLSEVAEEFERRGESCEPELPGAPFFEAAAHCRELAEKDAPR